MVSIPKLFASCKVTLIAMTALAYLGPMAMLPMPGAEVMAAEPAKAKKTRRTPALREKVYQRLARAQKLADDGQVGEGLEMLDDLKRSQDRLNSYERAMLWNFYAFTYYNQERYKDAIDSFEKVVAEENIPEALELSTLYSLAQIAMQIEDYDQALGFLKRWENLNTGKVSANAKVLMANAHYAKKDYRNAGKHIEAAIALYEKENKTPKENWLVLQRAVYFELKQTKKVAAATENLVRLHSKPKYWVELANLYGELGQEKKQMAVMEAAHQQGFVTKGADLSNLAQLYFVNGMPYKTAKVMSEAMDSGKVEVNVKNLQFLAQAWSSAKEEAKAIPVLLKAAELSDNGNVHARLAEIYVNQEQWKKAIASGEQALNKGGLSFEGNLHIAMGMAYFYQEQYDPALEHFEQAEKVARSEKIAQQWLKYTRNEIKKQQRLVSVR